jgi:DNA-binding transcriptional ArsR family regulator
MARANDVTDEPDVSEFDLTRIVAAIADPMRLSTLHQLATADNALSCGAIELPVKASTATHHFTSLR